MNDPPGRPDLRTVWLAAGAWAGGLGGLFLGRPVLAAALVAGLVLAGWRRRRGRDVLVLVGWLVVATATAGSVLLRSEAYARSPVAQLAEEAAFVTATVRLTGDPLLRPGRFEPYVLVRARVLHVRGRGREARTDVPVLVIGDRSWLRAELGSVVEVDAHARTPEGPEIAAVLLTSRPPRTTRPAGSVLDAAAAVRGGIREAVRDAGPAERTLVPALVVGDDRGMPGPLVEAFRVTGLTHLLAVSGTNLTLVVGFVLVLARWAGVRARGLIVVGALGVVGFVLLARTEPSVVRAATMGTVALLGLGSGGREKGVRALGVAVLVLLLADPWLVRSAGFALSVLATAGILFLAPPWRDAMSRWLPRWVAEAVAVPLAAQLACTPVVAALSGQVSLVAVGANLLAAPAVAPATVLGLVGGVLMLVLEPAGLLVGRAAAAAGWWITTVAERGASLPTPAVDWAASPSTLALLTVLCLAVAAAMPGVLHRPALTLATVLAVAVAVAAPLPRLPSPGWPPDGWVMVACDVGQGDAVVLDAGGGAAVVVDAGPDPDRLDRCLDRLDVARVPLVVLSHFHDDHVAGLDGATRGRAVGEVLVTGLGEPRQGAAAVRRWAAAHDVLVRTPYLGEVGRTGRLHWQVIAPTARFVTATDGATSSEENDASLVLLVEVAGTRILLTGDVEPDGQRSLQATAPGLRADVLKVPHHGSRHQDPALLAGLGARLALVSAGADNDYGHPAPETLAVLRRAGMRVRRTDLSGDVAVVLVDGRLDAVGERD